MFRKKTRKFFYLTFIWNLAFAGICLSYVLSVCYQNLLKKPKLTVKFSFVCLLKDFLGLLLNKLMFRKKREMFFMCKFKIRVFFISGLFGIRLDYQSLHESHTLFNLAFDSTRSYWYKKSILKITKLWRHVADKKASLDQLTIFQSSYLPKRRQAPARVLTLCMDGDCVRDARVLGPQMGVCSRPISGPVVPGSTHHLAPIPICAAGRRYFRGPSR